MRSSFLVRTPWVPRAPAAFVLLGLLSACGTNGCRATVAPAPAPSASASSSAPPTDAQPGESETVDATRQKRTTPGDIAARNLDSQVSSAEKLVEAGGPWPAKKQLFGLLHDRGAFFGRISDLERALDIAEEAIGERGRTKETLGMLASAHASLHRFDEATEDLDEALRAGEIPDNQRWVRASILEATGKLDEALKIRTEQRTAYAEIGSLCSEAATLGATGALEAASKQFRAGISSARDVAPFPIAWCLFEEGRMWERAAKPAKARALFAEAVRRLPSYAHAAQHLASLVAPERGVEILTPILQRSDDPTYVAALAELEKKAGKGDGSARVAEAKKRFEELERKHPAAMADHAARFWIGVGGDVPRGYSLARAAYEKRRTVELLELSLLAAEAAGSNDSCGLAKEVASFPHAYATLRAEAARAEKACAARSPAEPRK